MMLKKQLQMNEIQSLFKSKNPHCSLPMDIRLSLRHAISTCTSLWSQGDQNTMWGNPILSSSLGVQCWLSCYTTLTFPNRKCWIRFLVSRAYCPAQGTGSRGGEALSVSPAGVGSVQSIWVLFIAAIPDFLIPPPSIGRCCSVLLWFFQCTEMFSQASMASSNKETKP